MSTNYDRGEVVILSFPFITAKGTRQKARPALIISDHSIKRRHDDVILVAITSQKINNIIKTEYLIEKGTPAFDQSGLVKTSVVRCEYIMTVPNEIISRKIGKIPIKIMKKINVIIKLSLGC
ncbi:MAG: type II toxin-antitoxin system PemK/MazF family toxin [Bacteroidetes bacterium]|nr:type II toxin-antitoxin system PemK/MazF family toxin [Bacteroidota bacterium]